MANNFSNEIAHQMKSRGRYKRNLKSAFMNYEPIKQLLLGDTTGKSAKEIRNLFKQHVKSHLFIDDTVTDQDSYIFYDVLVPQIHSSTKECKIMVYAVCHKKIIDDYEIDGYFGNRMDILSEMIEDCLIFDEKTARNFGIGEITFSGMDIYNSTTLYGYILKFIVEDFR